MSYAVNFGDVITPVAVIVPVALTATTNGTAIDIQQYAGEVAVIINSAAGTGTSPTLDVKLQDSADGSTGWADIAGATAAQIINAAAIRKISVNSTEVKRYIRTVSTITGTTPSFTVSAELVGAYKYVA